MSHPPRLPLVLVVLPALLAAWGCDGPEPASKTYFEREIAPILEFGCASQTAGCHVATPEGTAAGNLDLSSYDALMRRRDLLPAYGPYPVGMLLLKAGDPVEVPVQTLDGTVSVTTDIRHSAGSGMELDASSYAELLRWIGNGFTRHGMPVDDDRAANDGECVPGAGNAAGFDPDAPPADATSYARFVDEVQPVLRESCAGSSCHGAALADLHLACGDDEAELRWNYWISVRHLADPPGSSELLRRPLATDRGGAFHGGGDTFGSSGDAAYQAMLGWAEDLVARDPSLVSEEDATEGYRFFVNRVQPTLVRKGCMALNCHSPISLKLNLRGGSQGSFSPFARGRNYAAARKMLALEAPDPRVSRLVAKNLFPPEVLEGAMGIPHRGGSLFEDFGGGTSATPADCEGWDAETDDLNELPAFCVIARWLEIEREEALASGKLAGGSLDGVVWVERETGAPGITDFDTFRPGADLRFAPAAMGSDGGVTLADSTSMLDGCGIDPVSWDVRNPAVSWDGQTIAFAARPSADRPLRLWWIGADGTGCEPIDGVAATVDEENGILTHDFDPAFAPDGTLAFASTRGNLDREAYTYQGPTRTPASMEPNANLYVHDPAGDVAVRQLTYLLNQEVNPAFMADGRVIFTAEKREEGFHQLALRRQNLDGGDYHPLYAQRPSLGFGSGAEVVHLPNLDFAFVASQPGLPDGAGTIAFFSRSIGPDQDDRDPGDRPFIHSMRVPSPGLLGGFDGVYRSPAALPSGRVLAACDSRAMVMESGFDFDICELDPSTGRVRVVAGVPGRADVEPVAIYARPDRGILRSDGAGIDRPLILEGERDAVVHFNDFPMIASLMFENTRAPRPIDPRIEGFDVIEVVPPPVGATSFDDVAGQVIEDGYGPMFVSERLLGNVPIYEDGSTRMRLPGGTPIRFRLTDGEGAALHFEEDAPFEGVMVQREQEQYYPGERIQRSIPRRFFNAVCGGCHGSITGRELDVAVDLDVISGASRNTAKDSEAHDIYTPPADRPPAR